MPVYPLAIEWVRKPPPVEDYQCQSIYEIFIIIVTRSFLHSLSNGSKNLSDPAVDVASFATNSMEAALQSAVNSSDSDNRKKPKLILENTSLNVETSSRRAAPTASKIKLCSSGAESKDSFENVNSEGYNILATSSIANLSHRKTTPVINHSQAPIGINKYNLFTR